jgi:hypothetical protein
MTTAITAPSATRAPQPVRPLDLPARVGPQGWRRLPAAVQRRFGNGHADCIYQGDLQMTCSPIGRLFAWASRVLGGPLTTLNGTVPATVRVYADAHGGMVWERCLHAGDADRLVRSTKQADALGQLHELTDGGLAMDLDVFEACAGLVFESRRYFLLLGGRRIPIPTLLTPGTCRVEHHDLGDGRFRFDLSMVHPVWGTTFRQSGVFQDPEEFRS